ncbi:MAG: hypothetical protein J3K34DRAFT_127278 [Monoraphidium minutum]|nr:MAG: hypothetical protein J3K34DRAFT_127278 [Monoraphidium minutum]
MDTAGPVTVKGAQNEAAERQEDARASQGDQQSDEPCTSGGGGALPLAVPLALRPPPCAAGASPPVPYSRRQFDRSRSFTSLSRDIELSCRGGDDDGGGGGGDGDDDSSSTSSGASDMSADGRAPSGAAAGGGGDSGWALQGALEVEEPSTETAFVMRSMRDALTRKETECEHLRQIIKELSQSRAKVAKAKVDTEESYLALQKEYLRVVKVSELARTVSAQNLSRSHAMRKELAAAHDAASRAARRGAAAADKARRLKAANGELRQRLGALEGLVARVGALEGVTTSASMREFLHTAAAGLY